MGRGLGDFQKLFIQGRVHCTKQCHKSQLGKESQAESLSREKENIMNGKLTLLEKLIKDQAKPSGFSKTELFVYPESFRRIHTYNLFGKNLLAIPASLLIEEDDDEFEHPFSFTDNIEVINLFESEFRAAIPNEFVQIGSLYNSTEIVLLHKLNETIHVFHVSDIADNDWLSSKLKNPICRLNTFIENLRQQTVCCLINPQNYSQYELLEIRHSKTLVTEE